MTFAQRVYDLLRTVPKGRVTTYKALAEKLGTRAYRAVGHAMKCNPDAPRTPCHRVVASNGKIGGFMGETTGESIHKKIGLLRDEGVEVVYGKIKDFEKVVFRF